MDRRSKDNRNSRKQWINYAKGTYSVRQTDAGIRFAELRAFEIEYDCISHDAN